MKTTWKIIKAPHSVGPGFAMWASGFRVGAVEKDRVCCTIEVTHFTDEAFLVVARWFKISGMETVV